MTSSSTIVNVSNLALLSIGARAQISNIQEGSTEAIACSKLFPFVFEMLARTAHWNCLRNQVTLSLLQAAQNTPENPDGTILPLPPTPWLYAYALPNDCLQMRFIVPSFPNSTGNGATPLTTASYTANTNVYGGGQIPYQVSYGVDNLNNPIQIILTNQTEAQAVYTINQINPQIWDSLFTAGMVSSLAAYLVPALSLNMALMNASAGAADRIIATARAADGNEAVVSQNRQASWMTARLSGSLGDCGDNSPWLADGYNMSWPMMG